MEMDGQTQLNEQEWPISWRSISLNLLESSVILVLFPCICDNAVQPAAASNEDKDSQRPEALDPLAWRPNSSARDPHALHSSHCRLSLAKMHLRNIMGQQALLRLP